jgi:HK97 family phage major capsid protein
MPTTQALREQRANVWEQMKEVMDLAEREGRDLTAEEREKYDKAEVDVDRLGDDIERQERHEARQAEMTKVDRSQLVVPSGRDVDQTKVEDKDARYSRAFQGYLRGVSMSEMDPEDARVLRGGWQEARALGVATQSGGGYLAPVDFDANLREAIVTYSNLLQNVEVITTDSGSTISWPTVDDTANVGAILAENTQVSEQDITFGTAQINAYKYTSKMIRVSMELLQDSAFDVEAFLRRALAARVGRIWNQHFTTGTGSSQPLGIVTGATAGKVGATGQTTTVTYDDLIDLIDSIDPAYQGNAQFMLNASTRKAIRKLKDTTNMPLWQPSIQAGVPDQLLGYGYVINTNMPVPAANAKSILFGDFRAAYLVRQVLGFTVLRLNERFADYGQSAFLGFARADGTVQNTAAYRAYQHSAT